MKINQKKMKIRIKNKKKLSPLSAILTLSIQRNNSNPSDSVQIRDFLLRNNSLSNPIRVVVSKTIDR